MKPLSRICMASLLTAALAAPAAAVPELIVLVRHAEKSADGGSDPSLSAAGAQRAQALTLVLGLQPAAQPPHWAQFSYGAPEAACV